MPNVILIPTALRSFTGDQARVEVTARTVGEALSALVQRYPGLEPHLFAAGGRLRNFVNVYVNDEDCRHANHTETVVHPGDVLSIVPAIAGGR
jgi:adenylyltransferase/sulfurtransferase